MTHQESNQPVFAAISDENGILEYAVQAHDLAAAIIAFNRGAITVRKADENITWHRLDSPPAGWEQWRNMGPEEYDAMVAAGSQETRGQVSRAVSEAATRLNKAEWSPWDDVPHCPWPVVGGRELCCFDYACWRLQMTRAEVARRIQAGDWPEVPPTHLPPMTDEQLRWRPGHREGIQRGFIEAVAAALGIEVPDA